MVEPQLAGVAGHQVALAPAAVQAAMAHLLSVHLAGTWHMRTGTPRLCLCQGHHHNDGLLAAVIA